MENRRLEPPRQVHLYQIVIVDGVDSGDVQVVAAGPELAVNAFGVPIAESADDGVGDTIRERRVDALQVAPAFEKV
jgi:hypothetical protein